ncbi:pilus assembly protein [Alkaliphilus pronyensis]|uniref:Pilus assembly protein n=1 Tax=Alkaliphilus pronyensis TaxID=1482732 RepID=A0A6I0F9Z5_9FIRM|nr:TadE family protein [Alkaliphilus pronyensis]KAB3537232.1 pilus assembly protein [Alkaliphilus pronyensis]
MKNQQERGSMTVELALIMPIVLYSLLCIIFMLLLLYQYAYVKASINSVIYDASFAWGKLSTYNLKSPIIIEDILKRGYVKKSQLKNDLYWRFGVLNKNTEKTEIIRAYAIKVLNKSNLLALKDSKVDVNLDDYIVYKKLRIDIYCTYQLPINLPVDFLNIGNEIIINSYSEAIINDPQENIRNTDYILELMDRFETTSNIKAKYNSFINEAADKVRSFNKQGDNDGR